MAAEQFKHQRSSGKKHVYDVTVNGDTWDVRLNGKLLRSSKPMINTGAIGGVEAARVWAIDAIEYLKGMEEE